MKRILQKILEKEQPASEARGKSNQYAMIKLNKDKV